MSGMNGNDTDTTGSTEELEQAIKDRVLEQLPLQLEVIVAASVARGTKVTEIADQIGDAFVYQLAMMVQGDVTVEETRFPATWWDAVKLRWTPGFLKKYVKAKVSTVPTKVTYNFFPGIGVQ